MLFYIVMNNEIYSYKNIISKFLLFNIVMVTVPITSPIATSEESGTDSDTDLSIINAEDEMHMDLSNWTPAEKKRLQHMTEFHEEYQ